MLHLMNYLSYLHINSFTYPTFTSFFVIWYIYTSKSSVDRDLVYNSDSVLKLYQPLFLLNSHFLSGKLTFTLAWVTSLPSLTFFSVETLILCLGFKIQNCVWYVCQVVTLAKQKHIYQPKSVSTWMVWIGIHKQYC